MGDELVETRRAWRPNLVDGKSGFSQRTSQRRCRLRECKGALLLKFDILLPIDLQLQTQDMRHHHHSRFV